MTLISRIILLLLISFPALAKDSIQLKSGYKANSTFVVQNEMSSDMEMSFEGNRENLPEQLRTRFPMKARVKSIMEQYVKTGARSSDSSYPFEIVVRKQKKYLSRDNSIMTEISPNSVNLEGTTMRGKVLADGGMQFVSLDGSKMTSEIEAGIKALFAQLTNAKVFAGKDIQIGGTVVDRIPTQIPLGDDKKMSFDFETKYTLKSIEGDIANFDVSFSALVGAEVETANIDIQVLGDGKMTYSISNQYSPETTTDMSVQMNIPVYGGVFKNISKAYSRMTTSYAPDQATQ